MKYANENDPLKPQSVIGPDNSRYYHSYIADQSKKYKYSISTYINYLCTRTDGEHGGRDIVKAISVFYWGIGLFFFLFLFVSCVIVWW